MLDLMVFSNPWIGALVIFGLRVLNIALDTLRMLFTLRGMKWLSWVVGFMVSLIYVLLLTSVLSNLDNPLYIIAYAAGFATGGVVGMWIEELLAIGFTNIQIISPRRGAVMAQKLRDNGYAVTEIPARGKDGMVSILSLSVRRKQVVSVEKIANEYDEAAFVTTEDVHPVRRGFFRA
ncbi:MAG: DUF5698 domain-containing protein [Anaerolineales bacterium]|jgi:uncharacterized protein YebE (UPF0316 family)